MNSKIKVDKFVIVVFLLCMVCNMTMQAKATRVSKYPFMSVLTR